MKPLSKTQMSHVLVLALIVLSTSMVAAPSSQAGSALFQVSCTSTLIYPKASASDAPIVLSSQSEPRSGPQIWARLPFDPYILKAGTGMSEGEQTFDVTLFTGNSVDGQINYSRLRRLSLETRPTGLPPRVQGTNFLSFEYQGKNITHVDYECGLNRID
jgi:hypothetical protein